MIGNRIKELRIEKGILQKDLAEILNLTQQTISLYESNSRQPDYEILIKFAEYFNVSLDYLLGRSDIRNPENKIKKSSSIEEDSEMRELMKLMKSLSEEGKKDLIKQAQLLKIRDTLSDTENETLSTSEKHA